MNESCILSFVLLFQTMEEDIRHQKVIEAPLGVFIFRPPPKKESSKFFLFQFYMGKKLPRQFNYNSAPITEKCCLDMNQTAVLE